VIQPDGPSHTGVKQRSEVVGDSTPAPNAPQLEWSTATLCTHCECERPARRELREQKFVFRGTSISLMVPVLICKLCGNADVDPRYGDPSERVLLEYRALQGNSDLA
jgi:hypothetical protein